MRTTRRILSLAFLFSVVGLAQTNGQSTTEQSKQEEPANQKSDETPRCAVANRLSGYALDIKLPKAARKVIVNDADYSETHKHDPICLSKSAEDSIFWLSGSGKKFKLKIYPQQDAEKCGRHPFERELPSDAIDGYFSGPLRPDVPENCMYNVEFLKEGEKTADPHIRITN
jgi:hypothetical protein